MEAAKAAARARMRDTVRSAPGARPGAAMTTYGAAVVTVFCHSCDRHFCDAFVLLPLTDVQEGMTYLQRHVPEDVEEGAASAARLLQLDVCQRRDSTSQHRQSQSATDFVSSPHAGLVAAECLQRVRDNVVWPRVDQQR